MQDNSPPVYKEDGKDVFRMSSMGSCPRALAACMLNHERDDFFVAVADSQLDGMLFENRVINMLRERNGFNILTAQERVELSICGAIIRGHTDGRVLAPGIYFHVSEPVECVLEIKCFGVDSYKEFTHPHKRTTAFPEYDWQDSGYALATGLPILHVTYLKPGEDDDKPNGELHFRGIRFDEIKHGLKDFRDKVLRVRSIARAFDQLTPCTTKQRFGCQLADHCVNSDGELKKHAKNNSLADRKVNPLQRRQILRMREINQAISELEAEKKKISADLGKRLNAGERFVPGNPNEGWNNVTWSSRMSLDEKALQAAYPEIDLSQFKKRSAPFLKFNFPRSSKKETA